MAGGHQSWGATGSAAGLTQARAAIRIEDCVLAEMGAVDGGVAARARATLIRLARGLVTALTPMRLAVWAARAARRGPRDSFVASLQAARRSTCSAGRTRRRGRFARPCEGRRRSQSPIGLTRQRWLRELRYPPGRVD